jgi:hypothetical protein
MIPNKPPPLKDSAQDECFGRLCRQRARRQANSDVQAGASKNKPHQEKKPLFSMLAITEGNETKHQQGGGAPRHNHTTGRRDEGAFSAPQHACNGRQEKMRERHNNQNGVSFST